MVLWMAQRPAAIVPGLRKAPSAKVNAAQLLRSR
jgi:hypothetical protein